MVERKIMLLHYYTGIAIIALVSIHIAMRLIMPFSESLEFSNVLNNYKNLPYTISLELLLITVAIHGFNGVRIILLEFKQGKAWESFVKFLTLILILIVVAWGTRTIVLTNLM
ncbi:MAG: succinate dehydrogenase [Nitrososphaerales archaeon]